jgi:hypothetical protein
MACTVDPKSSFTTPSEGATIQKSTKGTIEAIDRDGKTLSLRSEDGAKSTFRLTKYSALDAGKDIARGTEKGAHVTVYYSEETGKTIANFFE